MEFVLDYIMTSDTWNEVVEELVQKSSDVEELGLIQGTRHQEIVRNKLLNRLISRTSKSIESAEDALYFLGSELDDMLESVLLNQSKDGLDLDNELLETLIHISGQVHAVQVAWKEISTLLK